ncbi:transglutaminase domain-containing protein [Schaalia sp. Marseille-Q2122]|uniref:transglutaminase domain-containing protein n=1 Tax=Schaalia sp. Marseille-Q2122 TaxID=2736604 RepID=UPI00158CA7B2|nr:transglutaminase domain-containing protein [Schaalia sp. Marseille-Q2122]
MTTHSSRFRPLGALSLMCALCLGVAACTPIDPAPMPPSDSQRAQQSGAQQSGGQSGGQSFLPPSDEAPAPIPQPDSAFAWQAPLEINPDEGLYVTKNFTNPDKWFDLQTTLQENPYRGIPPFNDAQLYLDAELTLPLPTTNSIQGERYEVVPGTNWSSVKASRIYTHQGADKPLAQQALFTDGNWGAFGTYYLLQRTDRDGVLLERPEVTPIIVKGHALLPPPRLSYVDGRVLLSTGDLGVGADDLRIVKATREWDVDSQQFKLAYFGLPPDQLKSTGAFYDITGNIEGSLHSTNFVLSRARNNFDMYDVIAPSHQREYFAHSGASIFILAHINGRWQASAPTPLTPLAARVPVRIVGDPALQGAAATRQWENLTLDTLPNTVGAVAADGQVRRFATSYTVSSVEEAGDGSATAILKLSLRNSSLWREVTLSFDGNLPALEALLKERNERPIATEGTPLHFRRPFNPSTWVAEAPAPVEVPTYVFGTTPMARYIAAHLIAGYNRMSLTSFPEAVSYGKVENALIEAVSQNPEVLNVGGGYPSFTYDTSDGILTVDMRMVRATTREEYLDLQSSVVARAREIVSSIITPGMSDEDKARAINQWLIDNVEYDHQWLNRRRAETLENYGHDSWLNDDRGVDLPQQAMGALIHGRAICTGYGHGFLLLARHAGVESIVVDGNVGIELHQWNKAKINGTWLHFDSTWNDNPWSENPYVNLTDGQIEDNGTRYIEWGRTLQESNAGQFKNGDGFVPPPGGGDHSGARG